MLLDAEGDGEDDVAFLSGIEIINLFVTSKKRNHQFTNLKCSINASLLKPSLMVYYFLFITLKTF